MRGLLASCFGTGLIPRRLFGTDRGAGTVGAVVVLVPVVLLRTVGWGAQAVAAVILTMAAVWAAAPYTKTGEDPQWINIDEAAGSALSVIGLDGLFWLPAFVVFRLADATKWPPGVAAAERLPGAIGVTADDVVAGLWGLAAGWLLKVVIA